MLGLILLGCAVDHGKDTAAPPEDTGTWCSCGDERDGDGVDADHDCDDNDPNNFPGNTESCDGQDNDCDELVDEDATTTIYADADGDGFGDPTTSQESCGGLAGWVTNTDDCDDTDGSVNPDATELCNGVDENCNGQIDEGVGAPYFADADGDGLGDADTVVYACGEADGVVANDDDCDDADPLEPRWVAVGGWTSADGNAPADLGSSASPYGHIQDAIADARACVFVEGGAYAEDLDLLGKDLMVWGVDGAEATVVTGTGLGPVLTLASGESSVAWVGGLTLTGGTGLADADGVTRGGGVYVDGADARLQDLVVDGNVADLGGGLYVADAAVDLEPYQAVDARGNTANEAGGGWYVASDAIVDVSCSNVVRNVAPEGGGLAVYGVLFGDGLMIQGNTADVGAGVSVEDAFADIGASTVADNDGEAAVWGGGSASIALTQAIVAGNDVGACLDGDETAALSITFSDVWGCDGGLYGVWSDPTGTMGDISADPLFADPENGDYDLDGGSPCLGTEVMGTAASLCTTG